MTGFEVRGYEAFAAEGTFLIAYIPKIAEKRAAESLRKGILRFFLLA